MNLSLRNRVAVSFATATLLVLGLGFILFYYLNTLNEDIKDITEKSGQLNLSTEEIRISAVSILKYQRKILTNKTGPEDVDNLIGLCDGFTAQLHSADALYKNPEMSKVIAKMLSYVDSLKLVMGKASLFHRDTVGLSSIGELADKILEAFSEFQELQHLAIGEREKKIKDIILETKRYMLVTLIITFFSTILFGLIVPGKIALPFRKINDAIRELQDCNFDVSIYYNQDDEIGEISREMNKMILSFKKFEELRADRISVELRKFDTLANLTKKLVIVANGEGSIMYMNNHVYSLLHLQSDDVINKKLKDALIPDSIKDGFDLAYKRRSKIENIPMKMEIRKERSVVNEENMEERNGDKSPEMEQVFNGFANVIPIRAKDTNNDYYLMVLSTESWAS